MTISQHDQCPTDAVRPTWDERSNAVPNRRRLAEVMVQANTASSLERLDALLPEDARAVLHELRENPQPH